MRNNRKSGDRPGSTRPIAGLPIVRAKVAGIDIGSERHWVCAPGLEGSGREVADFGATTPELVRMAEWLKERKVVAFASLAPSPDQSQPMCCLRLLGSKRGRLRPGKK